jgi:hypothetical protein
MPARETGATQSGGHAMLMGDVRAEALMRAIDPTVRANLTVDQEDAIRAAARRNPWGRHPVNIRLSVPLLVGRFYIALVAGPEQRSTARLVQESSKHPLGRLGNLIALATIAATVGLAALAVVLLADGVRPG